MEPVGFGRVSQAQLERMVRDVWAKARRTDWHRNPGDLALDLSQVILAIDNTPGILEGSRLNHNLGAEKMAWLRGIYQEHERRMGVLVEEQAGGRPRKPGKE